MLYLKLYKPLSSLHRKIKQNKNIVFITLKISKQYCELNKINNMYFVYSTKICFFTFKYKTQLNVLHMSRHTLRTGLTFNKDNT